MLGKHLPLRPPRMKGDPRPPKEPRPGRPPKEPRPPRARPAPASGWMSAAGFAFAVTAWSVTTEVGDVPMTAGAVAITFAAAQAAWIIGAVFSLAGLVSGCRAGARGLPLGIAGTAVTVVTASAVVSIMSSGGA